MGDGWPELQPLASRPRPKKSDAEATDREDVGKSHRRTQENGGKKEMVLGLIQQYGNL